MKMKNKKDNSKLPKITDLIANRDWTGAITLLEFERKSQTSNIDASKRLETLMWLAYCHCHNNNYKQSLEF